MVRMTIEVPESALPSLRTIPRDLQGRAAEIAGLSRSELIDALGRFGVSPFQYGVDELVAQALSLDR